jgi:antitoxin PrlF
MSYVTVSNKGQVVIPAEIRRLLGIEPGSQIDVTVNDGKVELTLIHPATRSSHDAGFGMLKYSGPARRVGDFEVAELMRREREAGRE